MTGKEIEKCLQQFITHFRCKYQYLNKYIDAEQYVIDAICGAYYRADYNKSEKELYMFFDKRIKYHLINGLRRASKDKKLINKYLTIVKYAVLGNDSNSLYIRVLLDDVRQMTKYDVLPVLIGSISIRQLAKINGISTGAMRRWVLKAKKFIKYQLK